MAARNAAMVFSGACIEAPRCAVMPTSAVSAIRETANHPAPSAAASRPSVPKMATRASRRDGASPSSAAPCSCQPLGSCCCAYMRVTRN